MLQKFAVKCLPSLCSNSQSRDAEVLEEHLCESLPHGAVIEHVLRDKESVLLRGDTQLVVSQVVEQLKHVVMVIPW